MVMGRSLSNTVRALVAGTARAVEPGRVSPARSRHKPAKTGVSALMSFDALCARTSRKLPRWLLALLASAARAVEPGSGRVSGARTSRKLPRWLLALLASAAIALSPAAIAETVTVGLVGAVSSTHWPVYIGLTQGYYAAEDLKLDLVFTQSSASLAQQLTAGSLDIALSTGLADPIRAIDKGASIAIVRIEMQAPPYALMAKPAIKRWADLKGKTISIGGPKDITRIYLERMAVPNGVKPGDYDTVFAGATSARFSALNAGAVDAAILLPPFNFYAESAGFTNLGLTIDYARELPFAGAVVGRAWASAHKATLAKVLAVHNRSMTWFSDPRKPRRSDQDHGRGEQAEGRGRREVVRLPAQDTSSSKTPARSRRPRWARCSRRSRSSATLKVRPTLTASCCRA